MIGVSGTATFSVLASGGGLRYQWFGSDSVGLSDKEGEISGSNSATLVIFGVGLDNVGNYSVRITNAAGFVVSDLATLTIIGMFVRCRACVLFSIGLGTIVLE